MAKVLQGVGPQWMGAYALSLNSPERPHAHSVRHCELEGEVWANDSVEYPFEVDEKLGAVCVQMSGKAQDLVVDHWLRMLMLQKTGEIAPAESSKSGIPSSCRGAWPLVVIRNSRTRDSRK